MAKNQLMRKESAPVAGKELAEALAANTTLKELDLSGNAGYMDDNGPGFAKEFAIGLSANGALTSLNLASNYLFAEGAKHIAEVIKGHVSALRLD